MPPREDYQYLSLHDAYHARQSLVHVYGIVTEFTSPRPTRGTDYMSHVKIADPTVRDIRSGDDSRTFTDVQVQFFASRENLPRPRKVGDIIRLHRVEVKQWNGRPQFIAKVGVLQGGAAAGGWARCQFLLFDGDDDASDDPYQQSSNGYTFDVAKDGAQLARLRKHWMDIGGAAALDSGFTIAIQAIRYSENYDLHVRVLDVVNVDGRVTLIVWDGSDARPFPPGWRTNNMGVGGDSQSQEASEMIGREGVHFAPFAADQPLTEAASAEYRERRGDVPRIGTAFPVVMRQFDMQEEDLPARGQWIRLRKLSSWVRDGQLQGLFGQPSRWAQAEPNESWRAAYEKRLETRRTSMWAPDVLLAGAGGDIQSQDDLPADPENPPLTMTPHQGAPLHTLREILMTPPPSRHRCLVRVVGHFPKDVHDFCADGSAGGTRVGDPSPAGKRRGGRGAARADADVAFVSAKTDDSEHEFEVSLLLEDATGKLRAHLSPREARTFFHGIQPCDLWESEVSYARVADKMRKLTAHHESQPRRGWIECCIMSYVVPAMGEEAPEKRCYQIFGTSCVA